MQAEFRQLEEIVKARCQRGPVYFLADIGNWGDALIRMGTLRFLAGIGIEYQEISQASRRRRWLPWRRKGTLLFGGSGAWCRLWSHGHRAVKKVHNYFEHVVVLPSTFEFKVRFRKVDLFARDRFESLANAPAARFCHDMAFCVRPQATASGSGTGWFLRTDGESAHRIAIPAGNYDISLDGNHLSEAGPFFDAVAKYAVIHTDRLHVAIAACLLGRELHLYPGSYFKNRAVFRSSIEGRFPNAHFHEESHLPA
jgi:exopolysaccharide biosynthesis predicted pyruvyltransferase EpsI